MSSDLARNTYRQIEVNGANRLQLVVMLYEGAIRFLGEAKLNLEKGNMRGKGLAVSRTLAILAELQSTLKMEEGGEVAQSLDRLYTYMTSRILDANLKNEAGGLDESIKLLRILNSAWSELARKEQSTLAPPAITIADRPAEPRQGPLEIFG